MVGHGSLRFALATRRDPHLRFHRPLGAHPLILARDSRGRDDRWTS
jgi:hypothetical protein